MDFCLSFDQMLLNQLVKKFADIVNLTEKLDNFGFCNYGGVFSKKITLLTKKQSVKFVELT